MYPPGRIGKYEVLERIGERGYGEVYLGREPITERLVVLKVCTSEDETLRHRFLRAAEVAGSLQHRYIATVYSSGQDAAGAYLVQERLDGERLEAALARAEPVGRALRLQHLLQIARALDYAHKKGAPHRDLGPESIQILEDGRAKVVDFGIGKLVGAETRLARTGRLEERAAYLAPEQIAGKAVDERADLFAYGILAYELLTGVHPFPGTTAEELRARVLGEEPVALAVLWPEGPPEIVAVVSRCLEKAPERRGAGFSEVAGRLAERLGRFEEAPPETATSPFLPPAPPPSPPPAPQRRALRLSPRARRALVAGAVFLASALAAAVVVLLAWSLWSLWSRPRAPEEASATAPPQAEAAPPPLAQGTLEVDAVPWGEVEHLSDHSGRPLPLPAERATPLILHLPPGEYLVELANPASEEPRLCRVTVTADGLQRCRVEFYRLEPVEYFREARWWK